MLAVDLCHHAYITLLTFYIVVRVASELTAEFINLDSARTSSLAARNDKQLFTVAAFQQGNQFEMQGKWMVGNITLDLVKCPQDLLICHHNKIACHKL